MASTITVRAENISYHETWNKLPSNAIGNAAV